MWRSWHLFSDLKGRLRSNGFAGRTSKTKKLKRPRVINQPLWKASVLTFFRLFIDFYTFIVLRFFIRGRKCYKKVHGSKTPKNQNPKSEINKDYIPFYYRSAATAIRLPCYRSLPSEQSWKPISRWRMRKLRPQRHRLPTGRKIIFLFSLYISI